MRTVIIMALVSFEALAVGCGEQILRAVDGGSSSRIANQQVASIIDEIPRPSGGLTSSTEIRRVEDGLNVLQARPEAFYETVKTKAVGVMSRENGMFQGVRYSNVGDLEAAIARDTKTRIAKGQLILNPRDGNFYSRTNVPRAGSSAAVSQDAAMNVTREGFPMNLYLRTADDAGTAGARAVDNFSFTPDRARAREAIDAIAESDVFSSTRVTHRNGVETTLQYSLDHKSAFSKTLRDRALPANAPQIMKDQWSRLDSLEFVVDQAKDGKKTLFYRGLDGQLQKIGAPSQWGFGTVIAAP